MSDQHLIQACIANDRRAQHQLYERYKNAMYTLAYRITADFELAGEALQDAFLNVFRHLGSFEGKSTLGAWIKTIVVREAVRKVKRKAIPFDPLPDFEQSGALDWGALKLEAAYLEQAILNLPNGFRQVFILVELEGWSHAEIADLLGISEGTSRSQLFHAKRRLQSVLTTL
ncbi:MAG: RNA polymerase sigma factor [Bacteroidetes bacterium]|nr:RNA polymerase sigma factor [Bacteroidota bacterium]